MYKERAKELQTQGKELKEIVSILSKEGYQEEGVKDFTFYKRVQRFLHRASQKNIEYEDKKEYEEEDIENYIDKLLDLQEAQNKLDTKQTSTTIKINDDKPIAIANWGDWHLGCRGTDYKQFKKDVELVCNTEGLYFIGAGDYKDNYISVSPVGGNNEQIAQTSMQDKMVMYYMTKLATKCLALIRGCHDDWDKKASDRDFIEELCNITDSVNLWHGGELNIKLGNQEYKWRARHKSNGKSALNLENAMRRLGERQGPCDVASEAHLHDPYVMTRQLCGQETILMRSGSYKRVDEFGQKIGGYSGRIGVPTVILYPDKHKVVAFQYLEDAIKHLEMLRNRRTLDF